MLILGLLFLLQCGAGLAPKAFAELGPASEGRAFLAVLFGTAALTFLPEWLGAGGRTARISPGVLSSA